MLEMEQVGPGGHVQLGGFWRYHCGLAQQQ